MTENDKSSRHSFTFFEPQVKKYSTKKPFLVSR